MRRHGFDPLSFGFGLVFAAAVVLFTIDAFDFAAPRMRWLGAGLLLLIGLLMIVTSRSRARDDS